MTLISNTGLPEAIHFDPYGTAFRYGNLSSGDYMFVDMPHVKNLINMIAEAFKTIKEERIKKYS